MTPPLRRRTSALGFPLALIAALALLLVSETSYQRSTQAIHDMAQSYQLRVDIFRLQRLMVDAETGQRGYLITRDAAYLEPYNVAVGNLSHTYQSLLALLGDNPTQRARIEGLVPDLDAKRAEMARTIELMSAGQSAEALALLRSDTGLELMDRIRTSVNQVIGEEDENLIERNGRMELYRQLLDIHHPRGAGRCRCPRLCAADAYAEEGRGPVRGTEPAAQPE